MKGRKTKSQERVKVEMRRVGVGVRRVRGMRRGGQVVGRRVPQLVARSRRLWQHCSRQPRLRLRGERVARAGVQVRRDTQTGCILLLIRIADSGALHSLQLQVHSVHEYNRVTAHAPVFAIATHADL